MAALASKCVGKWGAAATVCGCGQQEVLEVGCGWSGRGPGGPVCLVWLWDPGGQVQLVGLGSR